MGYLAVQAPTSPHVDSLALRGGCGALKLIENTLDSIIYQKVFTELLQDIWIMLVVISSYIDSDMSQSKGWTRVPREGVEDVT